MKDKKTKKPAAGKSSKKGGFMTDMKRTKSGGGKKGGYR